MLVSERSITKIVRDLISSDFSFQDSLSRGYCNISSLARIIKPQVDSVIGKNVNLESIITALKRTRTKETAEYNIARIIAKSSLHVITDIAKISISKDKKTLMILNNILSQDREGFISISESINSITIIFNNLLLKKVKALFKERDILEIESDMAAIIVQSPEEIIKTPGCASLFYNQLVRQNINIEDTVSCYTDTIIIVKMDDVANAFNSITDLISNLRRSS